MDKNSFKKIIHKLSWIDILLNCIPFIIIVISIFYFFSKSNFTAFEPNTHSFIPAFELQNSDDIDFYTSSIFKSPQIIIVHLINFFFSDWYYGIYFVKILLNLLVYLSIWYLYTSIIGHTLKFYNININNKIYLIIILLFIFFTFGLFSKLQGAGSAHSPLGFGSIHFKSDFNPSFLSFILGIYAMVYAFKKDNVLNPISILIIFISTIIHPAMGVNNLIFLFLFYIKKIDFYYLKKFLIFSFFSIVIPIIVLKINFPTYASLSGKEFFDIYVGYRHPHHYLVSERIFNLPISFDNAGQLKIQLAHLSSYIVWFIILFFITVFSYFHTKKIFLLNLLIFCGFNFIALIQYFFVEVLYIKIFIELGITRFTTLLSIIFVTQLALNFIFFISNNDEQKIIKKNNQYDFKLNIFKSLFCVFIITLIIIKFTYVHPLNDSSFKKYHLITKWVNKNIDDKKEFIIKKQNDFNLIQFLRVFGKQKIFYDKEGFPFSPTYIKEYFERSDVEKKILDHLQNEDNLNIDRSYKDLIGYILFENKEYSSKEDDKNVIYKDEFFIIKKIKIK